MVNHMTCDTSLCESDRGKRVLLLQNGEFHSLPWELQSHTCCMYLVRQQQSHADLYPPPLPVRHGVEALVEVNVEHLNEA